MPTYLYEREDGTSFEIEQKISEDAFKTCPTTGQKVRRVITASAFHLKGSGWYKTDYGSSSSSGKSEKKSESSGSTEGGTDGGAVAEAKSADSKEAPKADAPKKCNTGCGCH